MMNDWVPQEEVTVHDTPTYFFSVEEFRRGEDQMVFLHLTVHDWKLSVFKEILRNWKLFRKHVTCPLYALGSTDDEKWASFVTLLGFKFLMNVICENGESRRLFINLKEHPSVVQQANNRQFTARHDQPVVSTSPLPHTGV